jgi:hypothetical protein
MYVKLVVAILLIASAPVCAQAQNPGTAKVSEGDAQKAATISSSDKVKTKTFCNIQKLAGQIQKAQKANEKKDSKTLDQMLQKIETMEKTLGPEYIALIEGIQDIVEKDELRAEFSSAFVALVRLCAR